MDAHAEKPEYLGLLNAISLAESDAGVYLEAWANATTDEGLAGVLRLVAARERSHGEVFCRRAVLYSGWKLNAVGAQFAIETFANPFAAEACMKPV